MTDPASVPVNPDGRSGLGLVTLVISILAATGQLVQDITLLLPFLFSQFFSARASQAWLDFSNLTSLCSCVSPALAIFGLGLGIASLVQPGGSKRLGVIGLILNASVLVMLLLYRLLAPVIVTLLCKCAQ